MKFETLNIKVGRGGGIESNVDELLELWRSVPERHGTEENSVYAANSSGSSSSISSRKGASSHESL